MKRMLTLLAIAFIGNALWAQGAITGSIPDWTRGSGEVALVMMGPPKVLGTFDAQGRLEIPTPARAVTLKSPGATRPFPVFLPWALSTWSAWSAKNVSAT